jgi:hypothetical protein
MAEKPWVAVTGSRRPYIFDLPQLLSLPENFEFRFRYRYEWVASELKTELDRHIGRRRWWFRKPCLAGHSLLVVFHSQDSKRLLPLRRCTIVAAELLGPMVFIRFRVGPFVAVSAQAIPEPPKIPPTPPTPRPREEESQRLTEQGVALLELAGHDLRDPLPTGHYLRRASRDLPTDFWTQTSKHADREALSWAAVAALLQSELNLKRVPLFRLMGFQRRGGTFLATKNVTPWWTLPSNRVRGFRLTEGKRYRLRLLEWCETIPTGEPGIPANVAVSPERLSLEGSSNLIVGKYDVLEFSCLAGRPGFGELAIRAEPTEGMSSVGSKAGAAKKDRQEPAPGAPSVERGELSGSHDAGDTSRPWPYVFAARVPIRVSHSLRRVGIMGAVGAVGLYLYLWTPSRTLPNALPIKAAAQLAGLLMMFTALGEYLHRFAEFTGKLKDIPMPGAPQLPTKGGASA